MAENESVLTVGYDLQYLSIDLEKVKWLIDMAKSGEKDVACDIVIGGLAKALGIEYEQSATGLAGMMATQLASEIATFATAKAKNADTNRKNASKARGKKSASEEIVDGDSDADADPDAVADPVPAPAPVAKETAEKAVSTAPVHATTEDDTERMGRAKSAQEIADDEQKRRLEIYAATDTSAPTMITQVPDAPPAPEEEEELEDAVFEEDEYERRPRRKIPNHLKYYYYLLEDDFSEAQMNLIVLHLEGKIKEHEDDELLEAEEKRIGLLKMCLANMRLYDGKIKDPLRYLCTAIDNA